MISRLLQIDAKYTNQLRLAEKPGISRNLAAFLAHSGDSWFWFLGLGLAWLLGPPEWRKLELILIISILGLAVIVMAIKFLVRRKRPEGDWGGIYRRTDPHSFPSGHAARAALLAVLAISLGPTWFGILLLIWAPLVILARVAMGVHYLTDVLAGALLGILVATMELLFIL